LSDGDWRGLDGPTRNAIGQWITDGGNLFVACTGPPHGVLANLPVLNKFGAPVPVGFGTARIVQMRDRSLDAKGAAKDILDLDSSPLPRWDEDFNSWPLIGKVGLPGFSVPAIIAFVIVFAAAIGPVNLLWLASHRRRHRLFYTIPLLSVGGCLVLSVCILLGDGMGANGRCNALVLMSAGENRLSIVQEQVCRSHLLFTRSFRLPDDVSLASVSPKRAERSLERSGGLVQGDWFRSRETEIQALQASTPSRAAVALQAPQDGAPVLLSSAAATFPEVYFVDASGKYWHGLNLTPGRPLKLEASNEIAYKTWLQAASDDFSRELHQLLDSVSARNGCFYATAERLPEAPITTLPSIHWDRQSVVCFGSCTSLSTP
jgi:hypothetical protein